ncbi:hypothetical protein C2G38_2166056 [Gigaspora rosea]|uniref:Uncharacterized protein n=1 Tax=Gigaspora rosea TaxID=44941 RepID=A0A397VWQ4_9GLOM|nr:hypothetical protein C2G38_2166056 [Gigaspora rosea]
MVYKKSPLNKNKQKAKASDKEVYKNKQLNKEPKANNESDEESSNQSVIKVEDDRNMQESNTDNDFSTKNEISALLERLETLEKLQAIHNKKTKIQKFGTNSDDTNNDTSKKRRNKNTKKKKKDIERRNKRIRLSHNDLSVEMSDTIQSSSQASTFSTLNETLEESLTNSTNNARLTSSSRTLLNTLQYQNNHGIQNISSNNIARSSEQTEKSYMPTKGRSLKMPSKAKINDSTFEELIDSIEPTSSGPISQNALEPGTLIVTNHPRKQVKKDPFWNELTEVGDKRQPLQ